ncbi:MAG: c-type cytochrome [Acidobacteriota bacterium]|nr:c-type cytochrome [Acidobacteriota bacterium]
MNISTCGGRPLRSIWLPGVFLLLLPACARHQDAAPRSPQESLQSMRIHPGFRVELFASEPDVVDPVEMAFDARGRLFVAEMLDLPYDPEPGQQPRSRIRLLEDTDGDGRPDRSRIFADRLQQVTSVLPWKGRLLVTAAPDIIYLKDTNGDGRADSREVLFTGFALVDPEARITNLRFSVDNWIYASNNGRTGEITFSRRPDAPPVSVQGADFRFRLDRNLFEPSSGPGQFGIAMDDWGNRFITSNTTHVRHVVFPWRYLRRNPFLVAGKPALDISDHGQPLVRIFPLTRPQRWRRVRTRMRQQRYEDNKLDRVEHAGGYFSGAAGGTIYGGDLFPEAYRGNLFTGDVSANLVHRDLIRPDGVSYLAGRAPGESDREFLASTDVWFRPCNFANGPDGALYMLDMYREFIETPESVPEFLKEDIDFYSGDRMGRIYRIVPRTAPPRMATQVRLASEDSEQLLARLAHRNIWWRLTAHRLLVERQDRSVVPGLAAMVASHASPQARLHALNVLEGLAALEAAHLQSALEDSHPEVRVHAVRLSEPFPELDGRLLRMVEDPSLRVRFQLALSLGEFSGPGVIRALAGLARDHSGDLWFRMAVLSSEAGSSGAMLESLLTSGDWLARDDSETIPFFTQLASVIGARNRSSEIEALLARVSRDRLFRKEEWLTAAARGLTRGQKMAGVPRRQIRGAQRITRRLMAAGSSEAHQAARAMVVQFRMPRLFPRAGRDALDPSLTANRRELAIYALGNHAFLQAAPVFDRLLAAPLDPTLLKATLETLDSFRGSAAGRLLVRHWKAYPVRARFQVLDLLLDRKERLGLLLEALESGAIEVGALDWARKEKLLSHPDAGVAARAAEMLGEAGRDREKAVRAYLRVLEQTGSAEAGKAVFREHCKTCHLPESGPRIGPALSGVSSDTRVELLQSILNPGQVIESAYTNYLVETRDGRLLDGLIVNETTNSLTLRRPEAEDLTLLKAAVAEVRASSVSLMPDGFEDGITPRQMADLIAYLQGANLQ